MEKTDRDIQIRQTERCSHKDRSPQNRDKGGREERPVHKSYRCIRHTEREGGRKTATCNVSMIDRETSKDRQREAVTKTGHPETEIKTRERQRPE